ncbi:hypothetical protein EWM64_g7800 [Hericium alpestre]|uniref:Ion transport domain-containing protein n=1 Tax=Hericium alpestre TaxID=135208 RepID=A0A4Y9ZPM2_9AGAM|nr:hypothetical protein EWM64_g7800 [Hericium alpestre]
MSTQIPLARIASASAYSPSHGFLSERSPSPPSPTDIEDIFVDGNPRPAADPSPDDIHPRWKRRLHHLLEHPTSSPSAFLLHWCITGLILFSALVTTLETVPAFHAISGGVWFGLESSLVALFTVEYLARCIAWSYSWSAEFRWVGSFFGILDLLAILPYYIEIAMQEDTSTLFRFSILRTFRLLRVFRPFRYSSTLLLHVTMPTVSGFRRANCTWQNDRSHVPLVSPLPACSARAQLLRMHGPNYTLLSEALGTQPSGPSSILTATPANSQYVSSSHHFSVLSSCLVKSIPAAAWFVIVTITTVGYGEITPRSFLGRLITLPLLVFGLLLIALPSFVLGREFSIVWNEMTSGQMSSDTPHFLPHENGPDMTARAPGACRRGCERWGQATGTLEIL